MSAAEPVAVNILDKEFLVACSADERPGLLAAAAYLDGKMRDIRGNGRIAGLDRIAVLAALNLAHELMALRQKTDSADAALAQHLNILKVKLDAALDSSLK